MTVCSKSVADVATATGVVSIGHRLFDGLSVASATDVQMVLAAEAGVDEGAIAEMHPRLEVRCLERLVARREKWTSAHVGALARSLLPQPEELSGMTVVPYAAHEDLPPGVATLGPTPVLRRSLDDKRRAKALFAELGLPTIDGFQAAVDREAMRRAARMLGYPFVLRAPTGSAGSTVFLVTDAHAALALARERAAADEWLFERFVSGYSLNVTGVVLGERIAVLPPSVQIIGQPICSAQRFAYCGSDYASATAVPYEAVDAATAQTRRVGREMAAAGYRGVFGMDYVVARDGAVYPIEINPRCQNSTALLNFALPPHQTPAGLQVEGDEAVLGGDVAHAPLVELSQAMVYGRETTPQIASAGVASGIYRCSGRTWRRVSPAFDPRRLRHGEVLAVGTVERAGTLVAPGAALGRLVFRGPAFEADLSRLKPHVEAAIAWLRGATPLISVTDGTS